MYVTTVLLTTLHLCVDEMIISMDLKRNSVKGYGMDSCGWRCGPAVNVDLKLQSTSEENNFFRSWAAACFSRRHCSMELEGHQKDTVGLFILEWMLWCLMSGRPVIQWLAPTLCKMQALNMHVCACVCVCVERTFSIPFLTWNSSTAHAGYHTLKDGTWCL